MSERRSTEKPEAQELAEKLAESGLRLTSQRERVYHVLREQSDHPTADEVFLRSRAEMPEISIATVYNTLDALVRCGLVRQVNVDRAATRYCCNMEDHCHFYCEECGKVHDIQFSGGIQDFPIRLPRELAARQVDLSIRGACRNPGACGKKDAANGPDRTAAKNSR